MEFVNFVIVDMTRGVRVTLLFGCKILEILWSWRYRRKEGKRNLLPSIIVYAIKALTFTLCTSNSNWKISCNLNKKCPVENEKEIIPSSSSPSSKALERIIRTLRTSTMRCEGTHFESRSPHTFVIFGASGDLAARKIYPTLWWLYRDQLLPQTTTFCGYARSRISLDELRENAEPHMKVGSSVVQLIKLWFTSW